MAQEAVEATAGSVVEEGGSATKTDSDKRREKQEAMEVLAAAVVLCTGDISVLGFDIT